MTQGRGGWDLSLRCITCGATATFSGVVPTLAAERAARAGWGVPAGPEVLILSPDERQETCPACSRALAG